MTPKKKIKDPRRISKLVNEEREKEMQELKEMVIMCLAILESQRKIK